jgi:type VI secretion system secreted protein Hcp
MTRIRLLGAVGVTLVTVTLATSGSAVAEGPQQGVTQAPAAVAQQTAAATTGGRAAAFLRIDGPQGLVQGEATDASHKGWIELASFQFSQSPARSGGGSSPGAGAGRVNLSEISVTKHVDKASTPLRMAMGAGTHFKDAIIELTKPSADGRTATYYRVTMSDVAISSDRVNAASGASPTPTESVTFNFGKIAVEYSPQKADGSPAQYQTVHEGYDIATNVKM